jgi:hypothetical protein
VLHVTIKDLDTGEILVDLDTGTILYSLDAGVRVLTEGRIEGPAVDIAQVLFFADEMIDKLLDDYPGIKAAYAFVRDAQCSPEAKGVIDNVTGHAR